ncbi:MAG: RNA 2',3'-cyclic phosphodiesterase [bacterium]|nr:RNA 2',3'-cyclic phosphodiesterase [bacterium]
MKKRLFIAYNLPESLKKNIAAEIEKFRYDFTNDIKFLTPDHWHITVTFLGYQDASAIPAILSAMESAVEKETEDNIIQLTDITYGPIKGTPRMIWLNGDRATSDRMTGLKDILDMRMIENGVMFRQDNRRFNTHITLARFNRIAENDMPKLAVPFKKTFPIESLDLMESHLGKEGATYELLQKIKW